MAACPCRAPCSERTSTRPPGTSDAGLQGSPVVRTGSPSTVKKPRGAIMRKSASRASWLARSRARSVRSPSAKACSRQAMRRNRCSRCRHRVFSANTVRTATTTSWSPCLTDAAPELRRSRAAYVALWGTGVASDVLVWTASQFDSRLHLAASLPATVVREGRLLHAA